MFSFMPLLVAAHTHTQMANSNSGKREKAKQNTRGVSKRAKAELKNAARVSVCVTSVAQCADEQP